jgi:peptide/nickel transport system permease protein
MQGRMRPEEIHALKAAYGFSDAPLPQQYLQYLVHAVQGDFGRSISLFPTPVTEVIAASLPWTILLGFTAVLLSFVLGTLLGILGTWRRGGWIDTLLPPLLALIGTFPFFWVALVLLYLLGFQLHWFPLRHAYDIGLTPGWNLRFVGDIAYHLALPALAMILTSIGGWMMGMRNVMIGILAEDYITLAEAKGLPQAQIMLRYAARNALIPNITNLGMALGYVFGGQVIVELIFGYPGIGYQLVRAVSALDYPLMQGTFLVITLAVLLANLVVDLLYVRLDPRVRAG